MTGKDNNAPTSRRIPVWAWIVGAVLVLAIIGGIGQALGFIEPPPDPAATATPTSEPEPSDEPTTAPPRTTPSGLHAGDAKVACDRAASSEVFPHKWNPHWIAGRLAEEVQGDRWFLKASADVESDDGGERRVTIECYVTGTSDAPVVDSIDIY